VAKRPVQVFFAEAARNPSLSWATITCSRGTDPSVPRTRPARSPGRLRTPASLKRRGFCLASTPAVCVSMVGYSPGTFQNFSVLEVCGASLRELAVGILSDFSRWSQWFGGGLELQREKPGALAMMGWIAAHAASDGSGLEFDGSVWEFLAEETGLTAEEGKAGLDALIAAGLVTAVGQSTTDRFAARAVI
jgi:hypothetical protein